MTLHFQFGKAVGGGVVPDQLDDEIALIQAFESVFEPAGFLAAIFRFQLVGERAEPFLGGFLDDEIIDGPILADEVADGPFHGADVLGTLGVSEGGFIRMVIVRLELGGLLAEGESAIELATVGHGAGGAHEALRVVGIERDA